LGNRNRIIKPANYSPIEIIVKPKPVKQPPVVEQVPEEIFFSKKELFEGKIKFKK
jgi:hypothetical protein